MHKYVFMPTMIKQIRNDAANYVASEANGNDPIWIFFAMSEDFNHVKVCLITLD